MNSTSKLKETNIISNEEISPEVFVLKFKRDFNFVAGQVISIALHIDEQPRMYSIASGTQDDEIWILYNIKPDGELTPELSKLKAGDTIYISAPEGSFYGTAKPSVWIASGTGIAPFVSMWRSDLTRDKLLIHGGRFLHSFYFEEEFKNLLGKDYIRCCSQESGDGVYYGRLTHWLREQQNLPTDRKYYLCGSAEMVVETRDILIEKEIPYENIVAEIYF
jgi:ferredoxin--NADP+ reductase